MMTYLMNKPEQIIPRKELYGAVWKKELPDDPDEEEKILRTVDTRMVDVRKALGKYADWIVTIKGRGYVLRRP